MLSDGTVLKRCASLTLLEVAGAVITLPSSLCPFLENVSARGGGGGGGLFGSTSYSYLWLGLLTLSHKKRNREEEKEKF